MSRVNGPGYCRMFDFSRDSWKQLIDKKYSKSWNTKERSHHLATIDKILNQRIKNNDKHYLEEVNEYEKSKKLKFNEGSKNKASKKQFITIGNKKVPLTKNGLPNKTFLSSFEKETLDSYIREKEKEKEKPKPVYGYFNSLEDLKSFIK